MAKYNWRQLEKEYILSDHNTVTSFLKEKGVPNNGGTKKKTSGWKAKKVLKEDQKSAKTIEKVLEKESEREANEIIKINDIANELLNKIKDATDELNKNTDMFGNIHEGIVNRGDIKKLTSALKDISDILDKGNKEPVKDDGIIVDLIGALKNVKKD